MNKKNVFMFSGQGSQYYQMGLGLYQNDPQFRKWMNAFDHIANSLLGLSLVDMIYQADKKVYELFSRTLYTHPAIFMVESALALSLIEKAIKPDYVIGSSLGEFAAAATAGMISYEKALALVIKQADCIERSCEPGGVIAVFEKPELYDKTSLIKTKSELAAISSDTHFVISGSDRDLAAIRRYFKENDILYQTLPVSHGFHSTNIEPALASFYNIMTSESVGTPQIPFISSLYGNEVPHVDHDHFWQIIRRPILFREALTSLNVGANVYNYVDLGPTGTLVNVAKHYHRRQLERSQLFPIMTQYLNEVDNMKKVREQIFAHKGRVVTFEKPLVAYLFPGQGAQKKGMGAGLFEDYSSLTKTANTILGYSIEDLCLHNPDNKLNQTQFTQPALYVVNILNYLKRLDMGATQPDYVAGHSLGEYCALFVAGVIDFETGLRLVQKRGKLMAQAKDGGMAAIIGLTEKEIKDVIQSNRLQTIDIANLNAPLQTVISGPKDDILQVQSVFDALSEVRYIVLNVSGAFHSRLMVDVWREFSQYIHQFTFSAMKIPVISNVLARPYTNENIKQLLTDQIIYAVKWTESIHYLLERNVADFVEVGPGNILSKLLVKIRAQVA